MKTAVVYAAMTGYEQGLNKAVKIIENTLIELGVEVESIKLSLMDIPYYDGIKSTAVEEIFNTLKKADGIVFACSASRLAPCGIMQVFLEHFDSEVYGDVINGKSCFSVVTSGDGSEIRCEEYLSSLIASLGGAVINRLSIGGGYVSLLGRDEEVKEMTEKYAEDFYRMLRQNRRFFVNKGAANGINRTADVFAQLADSEPSDYEKPKKIKAEELLNSVDLVDFNKQQEEDINELTMLLSQTYSNTAANQADSAGAGKRKAVSELYKTNMISESPAPVPHMKTCKQKTQSIIHYFRPQFAKEVNAVYQITIKGDEKFECYITIRNGECEYNEGIYDEADVSIYAQSNDWNDILNGKYTTQKGFMTGKLKVRGNFILLSKFDQFFKLQP